MRYICGEMQQIKSWGRKQGLNNLQTISGERRKYYGQFVIRKMLSTGHTVLEFCRIT